MRRAHPAAPAHRHLLCPGREGQRAVLRPQAGRRAAVDRAAVDLRPAHQQGLHAQDRTRSTRADLDDFVACYHPANRHERTADLVGGESRGPLARVRLRRADGARQGQPGHLLAARRIAGGFGQPARPGRAGAEIVEDLRGGAGAVRGNCGGATMDSLTVIATALLAGATAALKDTAAQAVRDAYTGLKSLIARK